MHRSIATAVLAASFACASPQFSQAGTPQALGQARALLERSEPKAAAEVLESALTSATVADRPTVLEMLRRAYDSAARQADAAGKPDEAELYRENLAILDRKPRTPATPPAATALPKTTAPADSTLPRARLTPDKPEVAPVGKEPSVAPAAKDANAARAEGAADTRDATPPQAPGANPAQPTAAGANTQIGLANKAFKAQSYEEAGRIYGALARENRLPKEYFNHLAYCRCVEIVKRINAKPASAEEWAQIDADIVKIKEMSPKLWFGDYLRNLAAERSKGQNRSRSNKVVVRGAAPEEPGDLLLAANGPVGERGPAAPGTDGPGVRQAPRPAGNDGPALRPAADSERWQVHETGSFRIFHADQDLALRVAEVAERTRDEQTKRWSGAGPRDPWTPKCDIYLYPTAKIFSAMTGQPEDSPGFSTMGMDAGRINCRRVNLRADHPKVAAAILPHEITHVVLADFFPHKQIPRWADEGMAVLAEPRTEQRLRAADLDQPLASGRLFHMGDLMVMDYPNAEHWGLYYAQSVSLTRFLVEQGTAAQFIDFVRGCQQRSHEDELRRVYKIEGFAELERRWLEFAKTQMATASSTADSTKKDADTASR
ncbi:MAG: hypothetical protein P4L84_00575 [Isosphaeraceae bacterium]|nr:hypothetical protein [Isosphaeraceae bacterium]